MAVAMMACHSNATEAVALLAPDVVSAHVNFILSAKRFIDEIRKNKNISIYIYLSFILSLSQSLSLSSQV
jgi:hypothetical protein